MKKIEVKIELNIKFYDAFFFGGGTGAGEIQAYLMKDVHGYPYISGACLKGCISDSAEALADIYPISSRKDVLFGREGIQQGRLFFGNGKLKNVQEYEEIKKQLVDYRTSVSINRFTKAKRERQLVTMETSGQAGRMVFASDIQGYLDKDTYKQEIAYLVASARYIFALGGRKSAGLGWLDQPISCRVFTDGMLVNKEEVDQWMRGGAI